MFATGLLTGAGLRLGRIGSSGVDRRASSFFVVGLLVGLLVATAGFAVVIRQQNRDGLQGGRIVLKLGHGLDQNHPVHAAMVHMSQRLAERSGGLVELQIFPNGQLGSETECIEQLQRGALAMTKTSAAPMESFVPEMAVFGVPYVFRDSEHFWRVLESDTGRELLAAGESVGLYGLCYYDAGSRSFYTIDRPILQPEDLRGLKIRVQQSKTAMDMVEALGGSPTPIAWGELYTALQQRLVDGAENNPPSFFSNRHFEVCKHLSLDEHTVVPDMLMISQRVWQRLPAEVQHWIRESAEESSRYQRRLWQEETQRALEYVQQQGVTVHYPDKARFAARVQDLHRSYDGTRVGELLRRIKELQ
jgi:tripartite ATP-independent transporter DctP family solute receptor